MEDKVYFIVKTLCAACLLYQLWLHLFRYRLHGFWERWEVRARFIRRKLAGLRKQPVRAQASDVMVKATNKEADVIGKTKFIYLEDPDIAREVPVRSDPLPSSGFIGEDEDISADDVEDSLSAVQRQDSLSEEEKRELMAPAESEPDPDFANAMTFEEMQNAVEVLTSGTDDADKSLRAAELLYNIQQTEIYHFLIDKVSNQERVDSLLRENLDGQGRPVPKRVTGKKPLEEAKFDWSKYV